MRRMAAIDIGTVTTRLLIADVEDGRVSPLFRRVSITQLGEGLAVTHRLSEAALERVIETIRGFQEDIRGHGVEKTIAVATSAARDAENAGDLIARLSDAGVSLFVIPGEREAALTFRGNASSFPGADLLVADIGGGSTELVFGSATARQSTIDSARSFDIGCRRMTDAFLISDPPTVAEREKLRQAVLSQMRPFFAALPRRPRRLIACAGTATTAVSVRDGMVVYDTAKVHGSRVTVAQLEEVASQLAGLTLAQRRDVVGLEPGRAPVIVAGMVIMQCVLELAATGDLTVSETDILQGILMDAYEG